LIWGLSGLSAALKDASELLKLLSACALSNELALVDFLSEWFSRVAGPELLVMLAVFQVAKSLSVRFNTVRGKCLFLFYWCEDQ